MAETTMMSPSPILGKRRTDFPDMANDMVINFDQSFKKIKIRGYESPQQSEVYARDPENMCPQAGQMRSPNFGSSSSTQKLRRDTEEVVDRPVQTAQQYLEQQIKYLECQIASLRAENQLQIQRKNAEVTDLTATKLKLFAEIQKLQRENEASFQEAKILKKAVNIQDSRYRELSSQNQQLQECLRLAMEKLEATEQANRSLLYELNLLRQGQGYDFFSPPPPPPDVY